MSPTPQALGPVRPAAVVNEEIRALVKAAGGWLYGESRQRYALLVTEWTEAVAIERRRGEIVETV